MVSWDCEFYWIMGLGDITSIFQHADYMRVFYKKKVAQLSDVGIIIYYHYNKKKAYIEFNLEYNKLTPMSVT